MLLGKLFYPCIISIFLLACGNRGIEQGDGAPAQLAKIPSDSAINGAAKPVDISMFSCKMAGKKSEFVLHLRSSGNKLQYVQFGENADGRRQKIIAEASVGYFSEVKSLSTSIDQIYFDMNKETYLAFEEYKPVIGSNGSHNMVFRTGIRIIKGKKVKEFYCDSGLVNDMNKVEAKSYLRIGDRIYLKFDDGTSGFWNVSDL